jgi:tripartite-type tricarboxylate transporter receptor subunit TctC
MLSRNRIVGEAEMGRRVAAPALASAVASLVRPAGAQPAWPDRPLRIIVPYTPAGTNDIVARLLAQQLQDSLGQPAIVENRPGAQAMLGTELVARARPDGLTLLVAASGPIVFSQVTEARPPYDPLRDLAPIATLVGFPLLVLVGAEAPVADLAGLIAAARARPERANYGSSSAAFQLVTELFNQRNGTRFAHVAYRGSAEVATAVATGEIGLAILDIASATPLLSAGRVRALAVTARARLPGLPAVPTMAEAGLADFEIGFWAGLFAPAATPDPVLARLAAAAAALTASPGFRERAAALQMVPQDAGPAAFRARIAAEIALWRRVAAATGLVFER